MVSESSFLKDVAKHEMIILRDDGLYRHIRFRKPDSGDQFFDLITWPGTLCYTGDMGTYVFCRLEDMFEFFRTDRVYQEKLERKAGRLNINPGYWAEKLTAVDRNCGTSRYSPKIFITKVKECLKRARVNKELREKVKDEVLCWADEGEHAVRAAVESFTYYKNEWDGNDESPFTDFWEVDLREPEPRYIWCCYALAWSIKKYDDYQECAKNA